MGWIRSLIGVGKLVTARTALVLWVLRHPTVPRSAKLLALGAVVYGVMPLDLLPDFIVGIGQIDDVVLVPTLILLAVSKVINATLVRYGEGGEAAADGGPSARVWSTEGPRVEASVRSAGEDPAGATPVSGYVVRQQA